MGPPALPPIRRKACWRFLSPLKIHRLGRVWTPTFVSSGKHTNHYNTNATDERTVRFTLSLLYFRGVRFGRLCVRGCMSSSRGGKEENPFSALSLAIVLHYYFLCFGFNPSSVERFFSLKKSRFERWISLRLQVKRADACSVGSGIGLQMKIAPSL
jgi:hypothetical protein